VAAAVAQVVPDAGQEILAGVAAAIPALKTPINMVLLANKAGSPSVSTVLDQTTVSSGKFADSSPVAFTPLSVTPVVKAPYVPLPGTSGNINPGTGGAVPTGGRDYATP
jgi:hypothetical protein